MCDTFRRIAELNEVVTVVDSFLLLSGDSKVSRVEGVWADRVFMIAQRMLEAGVEISSRYQEMYVFESLVDGRPIGIKGILFLGGVVCRGCIWADEGKRENVIKREGHKSVRDGVHVT